MMKDNLFRKSMVVGLIVLLFGAGVVSGISGFSGTRTNENQTTASFESTNIDRDIIELTIKTPAFEFDSISTENGKFTVISLPDEGFTSNIGEARLPAIRQMIEIPQGANPEIIVTSVEWKQTSLQELELPTRIVPVQPSMVKIPGVVAKFQMNAEYYQHDEFTPTVVAKIVGIGEIRGRRFVHVEVIPIQYNPFSGELHLMKTCELSIHLPGSDMTQTSKNIERYSSPAFEQLYQASFENYGQFGKMREKTKDPMGYLIIVHDNFHTPILPFSTWKETLGFDVTVTKTSEIPGGPSYANIESYIDDAYHDWPIPPTYVLLVGDTGYVPTKTSGLEYGVSCSDLYYAAVDPGDYYPDVYIGRFPAASPADVTAMVDKTLTYEQENYPGPEFLTYACFMAGTDNYHISEGTHNWCIDNYLEPNQWEYDKIYEVTYGGTTQDVRNALNDGRILAVFSGHGYSYGWADGPPFEQSDVEGLTNPGEYPFVFSHACSTGTFNVGECFAETWLREADKAGIFFWGASASTYWDEDDWLQKNWFKAWWDDGLEDIAGLTVQGMLYTVEDIGGPYEGLSQYYFEAYNIMGDPSAEIDAIEFVWENDVGAVEITNPDEVIDAGMHTVRAIIENFGINDQTDVPVSCEIFPGGEIIYFKDFEADNGGFTPGGTSLWQWGTPTSGPGGAHSGSKCWGTNLYSDYPDDANAWLDSEPIVLPTGDSTILSFWHWYEMEDYYDGGNVKISTSGGGSWEILGSYLDPYPEDSASSGNEGIPGEPCFTGSSGGWKEVTFDLGDYAGEEIILRWHFGSDGSINYAGWFIDDVVIDTVFSDTPVYSESTTVSIDSMTTEYVEFAPPWHATAGTYAIKVTTELPGDQRPSNDETTKIVTVSGTVPGDLDGDGDVDHADLGILLADWGCTGGDCPGDCDGDGDTDQSDLGILLSNWGYGT